MICIYLYTIPLLIGLAVLITLGITIAWVVGKR